LSNEPRLPWHRENLSNYVNLSFVDPGAKDIPGMTIEPLGCGSGLLGLPGDFTAPSRFVRAVMLNLSNEGRPDIETTEMAVAHAFRLADNVSPPYGLNHTEDGEDYTQWQVVRDHGDDRDHDGRPPKYYLRTYFGLSTQTLNLADINFEMLERPLYQRLRDDSKAIVPIEPLIG
jgi:choloylglycine hydrolase